MLASELPKHILVYCFALIKRQQLLERLEEHVSIQTCPLCNGEVQLRNYSKHVSSICKYRIIHCNEKGCTLQFPAHQLEYHNKYDCLGVNLQYKKMLISQARQRVAYARPWGLELELEYRHHDGEGGDEEGEVDGGGGT